MTILALDTTSNLASIAIRRDGEIVSEVTLESREGFAHLIFPAIQKCKNEANLSSIDCFAAASGPGSFTGVRVGLSVIKGLAEALGKPAVGVSNLRAVSSFGKKPGSLRAVVLDARRNQVYGAVYDAKLQPVLPETVGPLAEWLGQLDPALEYEFISPVALDFTGTSFVGTPIVAPPASLAAAVALCAETDLAEGSWDDPAALDANYVRRSDAELFWKDSS